MAKVHRQLLARLARGGSPVEAVLLDTPYGFQNNADSISHRTVTYFGRSLGVRLDVASWRSAGDPAAVRDRALSRVREAGYVLAGPGSGTYALGVWAGTALRAVLADKLARGGCVTFSSAAALTLGAATLPVYEIYKAGEEPPWRAGLDLLGELGLTVAVIPHYDNTEGRDHDTRFCYLGERRLRMLEPHLPDGAFVLGIDEHTACVLDVGAGTVSVLGLGGVSVRRAGMTVVFPAGSTLSLAELRAAAGPGNTLAETPAPSEAPGPVHDPLTLRSEADRLERDFDAALAAGQATTAAATALDLGQVILDWFADTEADDVTWAQTVLRRLVHRLGDLATVGLHDPREAVAPLVDALLAVREKARTAGSYDLADDVRARLADAGIEVRDHPDGTTWALA